MAICSQYKIASYHTVMGALWRERCVAFVGRHFAVVILNKEDSRSIVWPEPNWNLLINLVPFRSRKWQPLLYKMP
jgi:hypothetical protein